MRRLPSDPAIFPSPAILMAPPERVAYAALLAPEGGRDAIGVVDTDPASPHYGALVARTPLPHGGNEIRHLGWNACDDELHQLVVPGLRSSRIHVLDTTGDARLPRLVKVIDAAEIARHAGYAAPHAVHCAPDGIFVSALGAADGDGAGGILVLDRDTLAVRERWERDRGPQRMAGDLAWHPGHGTMITSEWGAPDMVRDGLDTDLLLSGQYGRRLHVWDLRTRRHLRTLDLGAEQQATLALRAAHHPARAYGFAATLLSLSDLSSSVFLWYLDRESGNGAGEWKARKVITIPAQPVADADALPPVLRGLGTVPPLVTDVALSLDDRWLLVSCWGTGEVRRYDVSDPFDPVLTGTARIGGIVARTPHPSAPQQSLGGGPQSLTLSRDGRRAYATSSLHARWDAQFHPEGPRDWIAKLDVGPDGGLALDRRFLTLLPDGLRATRVRLEGGDASPDACCRS